VPGFTVDPYLSRRHRGDSYNCLHFAEDVWADLTGEDLRGRLGRLLSSATPDRRVRASEVRRFERLDGPRDPCLVVMRRPRAELHVGVFLRGRVLHLQHNGAEFHEPAVASRGFSRVEYYL
jgi:hypothetical protein